MKILFIKPPRNKISIYGDSNLEPLEFEILAAPLKGYHDVFILDMRLDNNLGAVLKEFQPDVVGLTGYTVDIYSILRLAKEIKNYNADIKIVAGGHHASLLLQDFHHPAVDFVVIGNGEITFRELVANLEGGGNLENIPGIAINTPKGQILTPKRPIIKNLDELPFPDRGLTKRYRPQYFSSIYRPVATVITSRGCPFQCTFCSIWKFMEGKYLARNVKSVADELELIEEPYVFFVDDNLTSNFKHFEALGEEIKQRGIQKKYKVLGRTDAIVRRPDLIEKWREIGLRQVIIGMEAIDDKGLQFVNKNNTTENNLKAIGILKENGLDIKATFIVKQDFEKEDFERLYEFVEKIGIETPYFTILTPLPGTTLYEEKKDEIYIHNYEFYDLVHSVLPTKLPSDEFYYRFMGLYGRCYSPKKSIKRILQRFANLITDKPGEILPPVHLRKALYYSIFLPFISKRRYKQELLYKDENQLHTY